LLFLGVLVFLFGVAYVGEALNLAITWTVVFGAGAGASATYLVLALLALSERFRHTILFAKMKRKTILLSAIYGPIIAAISYWIYQAGSVEALPIFPYFIAIFYAWILSQAYFIANPISHAMLKVENRLVGQGFLKRMSRTLGITILFLPIAPLIFGIWEISSWANKTYANVGGSSTYILAWTLGVTLTLVATYFLTIKWGWKNIKTNRPQAAVFAGGTFLIVWGYLLYRGTTMLMGLVTQNQPSNAVIDLALMFISILGAMQTFARKTVNLADRRWSQALPFLVFSFGSVYAVDQFYFIIQGAFTRADLSVLVNGTVFVVGTLTLMLILRKQLKTSAVPSTTQQTVASIEATSLPHRQPPEPNEFPQEIDYSETQATQSQETREEEAGSGVQGMEASESDPSSASESENE
jgi:hypothetical protein